MSARHLVIIVVPVLLALGLAPAGGHKTLSRIVPKRISTFQPTGDAATRGADGSVVRQPSRALGMRAGLEAVLQHKLAIWNATPTDKTSSSFQASKDAATELSSQLRRILELSGQLADPRRDCALHHTCSAPAPELLNPAVGAFVADMLKCFSKGPTRAAELLTWAERGIAFLEKYHQLQLRQRPEVAAEAAKAEADADAVSDVLGTGQQEDDYGDGEEPDEDEEGYKVEANGRESTGGADASGAPARRMLLPCLEASTSACGSSIRSVDAGGKSSSCRSGSNSASSSRSLAADGDAGTGVRVGGLPMVRRLLLAQLLLGWLSYTDEQQKRNAGAQGPPSLLEAPEAEATLGRLVKKMYDIHVESIVQRAVMEYFHISKSGGTSWTAAAGASGCRRCRASGARVSEFDDACRWLNETKMAELAASVRSRKPFRVCSRYGAVQRRSVLLTCSERLQFVRSKHFQYISNEYTLHGGHDNMFDIHICPQFVNVISIREPLERLMSNTKYILIQLPKKVFKRPAARQLFRTLFCNASASLWEEYAPAVADNYNIRTLVGERAFHSPLYGIGEAHEALAKALTMQFDLVLDLNAGSVAADLVMRSGLGWKATLAEVHIWTSEQLAQRGARSPYTCAVGDISPLLARQKYDARWYSFSRTLSRLDQLFLSLARHLHLDPWPAEWDSASEPSSRGDDDGDGDREVGGSAATRGPDGLEVPPAASDECGLLGLRTEWVLREGR